MIVYNDTVKNFILQCRSDASEKIADIVSRDMIFSNITYFNNSQKIAWQNSLPMMAKVLEQSKIDDDVDVSIEYKINQTKDRVDMIIYGKDDSNKQNLVVIELKQWSQASRTNRKDFVHTNGGKGEGDYWHPSYQAKNYANILCNFNEYIQNNKVCLNACSYLHNMNNENDVLLENLELYPLVQDAPLFLKDDAEKLANFISKYVKHKDGRLLYEIENSKIVPSKHLSSMLKNAIEGNDFFSFDENQAFSVSEIVSTVEDALYYDEKKTIIIKGGPGTGKSIVAINVLGQLISRNNGKRYNAVYLTANASPRYLYTQELIKDDYKKKVINVLFKHPKCLIASSQNAYDCALIDEAHRVFEFKGGMGIRKGFNNLEEIIKGSRVNVFFIDEDQAVTVYDYATITKIKELAFKNHSRVIEGDDLTLKTQFRVLGGDSYISFIRSFLGYDNLTLKYLLNRNYDFKVFDKAEEMFNSIKEKDNFFRKSNNESGKCRLVAGYTYEWVTKGENRDTDNYDIVLDNGEFKHKWNLKCNGLGDKYSWLDDPDSISEVGCIHTCQGLDFNYCGVIIGKDLTYENSKIVFHKEANAKSDRSSGINRLDDQYAQKLIRNTYNVLLTRGMLGTYVYCEDVNLREYLKSLIKENKYK